MPTPEQVTPASQWKVVEGFVAELPSGNTARIKRTMDILTMIKSGKLPNPLAGAVMQAIRSKGTAGFDMATLDPEAIPQMFTLIDDIAVGSMLEPRVERPYVAKDDSPEEQAKEAEWIPSEGAIAVSAIPGRSVPYLEETDKMYLFRVAMGGATDLESFRASMEQAMATPQDGGSVRSPAKPRARAAKR